MPVFNKWIKCVDFPQQNYKGFKLTKIPYSLAHEKEARRGFHWGTGSTSHKVPSVGIWRKGKYLTEEELKKENPETFISASAWEDREKRQREEWDNFQEHLERNKDAPTLSHKEMYPDFYKEVSSQRLEEVGRLRKQHKWSGAYLNSE